MGKGFYFAFGLLILVGIFFFAFMKPSASGYSALENFNGTVDFYRSESCGCCTLHESYLRGSGKLNVKDNQMSDISSIKTGFNIPTQLQSCHTAVVGNYFVEGHIPLEAINKLISEKPNIKGIAMPGMPQGSPGMPGAKYGDFVIYSVNSDGSYEEFMRI
ncbi:hypothetical protein HY449_00680 [Candidatus Pacearchaeota archaeon]|nr:hypothetical protein [Candidatus Pacearchaeota archaeon]